MRWSKLIPVFILGAVAIDYVLIRPALLAVVPHLAILEFPVGAALVALLIWLALRRRRAAAPPPAAPWRRHEQVVRPLPDPAERDLAAPLARWLETGEEPERAAAQLARLAGHDRAARDALRARLAKELPLKSSRRKRESVLEHHLDQGA